MHLTRIGYWRSDSDVTLPDPSEWIDRSWDTDERAVVAGYLIYGTVARSYMGYASCRICGHPNGNMEFSDGAYIWPEGLGHYVEQHSVRLPTEFVEHAIARIESLEGSEISDKWWRAQTPPRCMPQQGIRSIGLGGFELPTC